MTGLSSLSRTWSGYSSGTGALQDDVGVIPMKSSAANVIRDAKSSMGSCNSDFTWPSSPEPEERPKQVKIKPIEEEKENRKRTLPDSFKRSSDVVDKSAKNIGSYASASRSAHTDKLKFLTRSVTGPSTAPLTKDTAVAKVFLSKEQLVVFERAVNEGKNVFFTGSAGTGKSVCLREIISGFRRKYQHKADAVAVTASTGIAACNIGGTTLHSFAGAGLCDGEIKALVNKIRKNRKSLARWLRTSVLVIDEISMIAPTFLDNLERIAREIRKTTKPFGGIQLVMTGDFFQLPPVNRSNTATQYAFDAKCWDKIVEEQINLTQVFRQKDPKFVKMLNELRFARLTPETVREFTALTGVSKLEKESGMSPTVLFPIRAEVERANASHLRDIQRPSRTFDARDSGSDHPDQIKRTLDACMAPAKVHLKMGAQVMLIKNLDENLVNGSIGTVMAFLSLAEYQEAAYSGFNWNDVDPAKLTEDEVRDAVHAQYVSTRNAEVQMTELERNRDGERQSRADVVGTSNGQPKSRAELSEAIRKEEKRERSRSASPERKMQTQTFYPVVRFMAGRSSGAAPRYRTILVQAESWKTELPNGEVLACRHQIPLILSWAMSIHKSQGQTLPLVKIDLTRTFEIGQAYVALSRAVSKEGLQVIGFDPRKVRVEPRVVEWYKRLTIIA